MIITQGPDGREGTFVNFNGRYESVFFYELKNVSLAVDIREVEFWEDGVGMCSESPFIVKQQSDSSAESPGVVGVQEE